MTRAERMALNWAVTVIGLYLSYWSLQALIRTTGEDVAIPIFGHVSVGKAVVLTIPFLFLLLCCLYAVTTYYNKLLRPVYGLSRIPPAFGHELSGQMLPLRGVVFVLFFVFPTASIVVLLNLFCRMHLINLETRRQLENFGIFTFVPGWFSDHAWRWVTVTSDGPEGYPGLQAYLYVLFGVIAIIMLLLFFCFIVGFPGRRSVSSKAIGRSAVHRSSSRAGN